MPPERLRHGDLGERLARLGDGGSAAGTRARLESLLGARQDIDANLAPEAVLDRALLALSPSPSRFPVR